MNINIGSAPSQWQDYIAAPGSVVGDQVRDAFYADLLGLLGDVRLYWSPETGETTTSTDRSRNARVITYDATVAARYSQLGSLWQLDFDGTDDEADTPDVAALSFGDSAVDEPFTVIVLCTPDVNNAAITLLAKEGSSSAEEWNVRLNASGHLVLTLTDESATATLTGTYAAAVGTVACLLAVTYDGSGAATGIKAYKNGTGQTTAAGGSGTYVAMENTAALVHLGARYTTKEEFFNGRIAFAVLVAGEVDADTQWAIKELVNAAYDLGL